MRLVRLSPYVLLLLLAAPRPRLAADEAVPLAGAWACRLDPGKVGLQWRWFAARLDGRCRLPGSTDESRLGTPNTRPATYDRLSRLYEYVGPAWYQRDVVVPRAWAGKRVVLYLERCHWETRVWLDGREAGMQDSLCVPHVHDLTGLASPGRHRLTLLVDNSLKYNMGGDAHSTSEQTQTNWNGVVGRIELQATSAVWLDDLQAYPDVARRSVRVRAELGNVTGKPAAGTLQLAVAARGRPQPTAERRVRWRMAGRSATVVADVPLGASGRTWDEFAPALYSVRAVVRSGAGVASRSAAFGLRDLKVQNKRFVLNGRRIFLRGTLECCIFPRTGYPPTGVAPWLRIFGIARSYGLNHMRFHSWCPPEAAFEAADQMGFLLHVEAPQWAFDVGKDPPRDSFIEQEVLRILRAYGSHPSFGMLCMGNELSGDPAFLQKLVRLGQVTDPRHLYTSSTAWSFGPNDDYNVAVARGLHGPTTSADFRDFDARSRVPVVSHEVGQWAVYPNLAEIAKYSGVLRARNFEKIRGDLASKRMLDQAPAFTRASGKLSALLYKEEIEVLLRTPGHGGFQLLDLHDFPGQGTATVGLLDAFWDSKGLITPEAFRRFCGPTVPLARLPKRTWTTADRFSADAALAHYGPTDLARVAAAWSLRDGSGRALAGGRFPVRRVPTGDLARLGRIQVSLAHVKAPARLKLTVAAGGAANDWDVWVYPASAGAPATGPVVVSRSWDDATQGALRAGRSVLLLARRGVTAASLPGSFTPVFWSPVWFHGGAGTMGILCDPSHPALASFPTDPWTNWQWYDLLQRSRAMVLDGLPGDLRPVVQVIDNFSRNHRLGCLFEARVGAGKLVVCSIDLDRDLPDRPAARQFLASLLHYMRSESFRPAVAVETAALNGLLHAEQPLDRMLRGPGSPERALLRVRASVRVPVPEKPEPWTPEADEVVTQSPGFSYTVRGGTWRDSVGAAWHDGTDLAVRVVCPRGFRGTLFAHFSDWNNLGRVADVYVQGRLLGTLEEYNGPGIWVAVPVTSAETAGGAVELSARPSQANTMITEIVVEPE